MMNVGIEYLTLDRRAHTLSGGEAQRIRLASQLGSGLVGALYVLDEPTIGLHQRDNDRLIKTLISLRDLGNTIIVVEHDEDTMFASDYIVDIGPKAGVHGGEVIVQGWLDELLTAKTLPKGGGKESVTLQYLRGEKKIAVPEVRREPKGKLLIRGGNVFNIKDMNAEVMLGCLNVITGVSGSGKSSFMYEILHKNLQARLEFRHRSAQLHNVESFSGTEYLSRVILIDQAQTQRHTLVHGHISAICSPRATRLELAAGDRDVFHSMLKVAAVKHAKETEKSPLRCISCRLFSCRVKSVVASDS